MADGFADVPDLMKKVENGMQICAFLIIIGILGTGDLIQEEVGGHAESYLKHKDEYITRLRSFLTR